MKGQCSLCNRQQPVPVGGIWLRRIGDRVEVLAEVDGRWRLVIVERANTSFSHIVEPLGIMAAPLDEVTEDGHIQIGEGKQNT